MKSEEKGLVPEPAEDLGHLSMSQGVEREGVKPLLGISASHPQFFSPSFVGFSIFDLLPNHISCFPEQLQHLQLLLTSSENTREDCQEGDARATLTLPTITSPRFIHLGSSWASNNARQAAGQVTGWQCPAGILRLRSKIHD